MEGPHCLTGIPERAVKSDEWNETRRKSRKLLCQVLLQMNGDKPADMVITATLLYHTTNLSWKSWAKLQKGIQCLQENFEKRISYLRYRKSIFQVLRWGLFRKFYGAKKLLVFIILWT